MNNIYKNRLLNPALFMLLSSLGFPLTSHVGAIEIQQLTNGPHNEVDPVWSPDGKRLAFVSDRNRNDDIWLLELTGGKLTALTHHPATDAFTPAWSPDGNKIAFTSDRAGFWDIWVTDVFGGGARRLTQSDAFDVEPSWGSDGSTIIFSSNREGGELHSHLWAISVTGGAARRLTHGTFQDSGPRFAPASETIAFTRNETIQLAALQGGMEREIRVDHLVYEGGVSWSPDGKWLAFSSRNDDHLNLWTVRVADGFLVRLTDNDSDDWAPSWSPDGLSIAFASNRNGASHLFLATHLPLEQSSAVPKVTRIANNAPNPFNPQTTIHFELAVRGHVVLGVYDAKGRLVRKLLEGPKNPGYFKVLWDGKDQQGQNVASGIYFTRLQVGESTLSHKMVLAR